MDSWKKRSLQQYISGAPGKGKTEVFFNEYGYLVDANGIPIYNEQNGMTYMDPETPRVARHRATGFTAPNATIKSSQSQQAPIGGAGVKSPWELLKDEPEVYNYYGPGIKQNSPRTPEESLLLRKLYGFE